MAQITGDISIQCRNNNIIRNKTKQNSKHKLADMGEAWNAQRTAF
jgi:hypothetical protein